MNNFLSLSPIGSPPSRCEENTKGYGRSYPQARGGGETYLLQVLPEISPAGRHAQPDKLMLIWLCGELLAMCAARTHVPHLDVGNIPGCSLEWRYFGLAGHGCRMARRRSGAVPEVRPWCYRFLAGPSLSSPF